MGSPPTFTTPVVAPAAVRQVHTQAPGRLRALDDVLIPQLSVADQRDRGHTWAKRRSGGSSREQVGLRWTLHADHSLTAPPLLRLFAAAVDISVWLPRASNIRVKGRRKSCYAALSLVTSNRGNQRTKSNSYWLRKVPFLVPDLLLRVATYITFLQGFEVSSVVFNILNSQNHPLFLVFFFPSILLRPLHGQKPSRSSRFRSVKSGAAVLATCPTFPGAGVPLSALCTFRLNTSSLFFFSVPSTHLPSALLMFGPPPEGCVVFGWRCGSARLVAVVEGGGGGGGVLLWCCEPSSSSSTARCQSSC